MAATAMVGPSAALGVAVLKLRLYDIDLVINRTIVYGVSTVGIVVAWVAVVAAVVAGVGALLPADETVLALVATGLVAVAFAPLRDQVQRWVNRIMFGQRDDPYAVLPELGRLVARSGTPAATLQELTATVATALKLPGRRSDWPGATLLLGGRHHWSSSTDDPEGATDLLMALKQHNQQLVADIRRLVYELRPPALDELGVTGALVAHVGRLERAARLTIDVHTTPDPLPGLPAAVEVAADHIAREALTNVARHARASRCTVRREHVGAEVSL